MDSFQLWKDDYRREVEDVLAERRRAREKGRAPGHRARRGFRGTSRRDLVIPPAGIHAEASALRSRLDETEAHHADLLRRTEEAEAAVRARARLGAKGSRTAAAASQGWTCAGTRPRLLGGSRAARVSARAGVADAERSVRERAANDEARVREARMDADHANARAEDAERASAARRQARAPAPRALRRPADRRRSEGRRDLLAEGAAGNGARTRRGSGGSRAAEIESRLHAELVQSARAERGGGAPGGRGALRKWEGAGASRGAPRRTGRRRGPWSTRPTRMRSPCRSSARGRPVRDALESRASAGSLRAASAQRAADEVAEAAKASTPRPRSSPGGARGARQSSRGSARRS